MKYTPGPWEWWTSNSFLRLSSRATGKDGGVIDSFKMSDGHTSLSVKSGDMRLIAAAPDLLEALQKMVSRIEYYANLEDANKPSIEDWAYTYNSSDMDEARAAIAKAIGKEE